MGVLRHFPAENTGDTPVSINIPITLRARPSETLTKTLSPNPMELPTRSRPVSDAKPIDTGEDLTPPAAAAGSPPTRAG